MKAVILAGGLGSRISEESVSKPKPMIEIGGMHIMKIYAKHGVNDMTHLGRSLSYIYIGIGGILGQCLTDSTPLINRVERLRQRICHARHLRHAQ